MKRVAFIGTFLLLLTSCSNQLAGPALTIADEGQAVIYHGDSREDVALNSTAEGKLAQATAAMIESFKVQTGRNGQILLRTSPLKNLYPLCSDEKFLEQPTASFCTATLIGPRTVLTAGHCLPDQKRCADTRFVFGWNAEKASKPLLESDVYHCAELIKTEYHRAKGIDYALVLLDREVTGITPARVAAERVLETGEKVLSLSHPLGLPLKKDVGRVRSDSADRHSFKVEVDTFAGSSGSALYNQSGEIIGLLSSGMEDILEDDIYRVQKEGGCINFNQCQDGVCFGETYYKVPRIDL